MSPENLAVCGIAEVRDVAELFGATHLLSLLDPGRHVRRPPAIARPDHLTLWFNDTSHEKLLLAPTLRHIEQISDWAGALPPDSRLLVHCFAGISRSSAVVLGLLAKSLPPSEAVEAIFDMRPIASPNPLIVRHWDAHLALGGELIRTLEQY